jgi:formate dehydrogenase
LQAADPFSRVKRHGFEIAGHGTQWRVGAEGKKPAKDHPWRTMPHHGMTPHISGSSLSAQTRYSVGTREILEAYFAGKPIRTEYLIVDKGKLAGAGARSYTAGDATKGSEEAARM